LARHVCKLEADDGVVDEFFAKGAALVSVFDGFFVADAGEAETLDDDANAFVVEVGHDYWGVLVGCYEGYNVLRGYNVIGEYDGMGGGMMLYRGYNVMGEYEE
jgi:hypothetical protein